MTHIPARIGAALALAVALAGCDRQTAPAGNVAANQPEAATVRTVTSKDGTRIAFDRQGIGPPLVVIGGALADRSGGAELAARLASHFTVYTVDRRGRGDSGDTPPYAVAREVEDIAALIDAAGGEAHLAGFSSGAALALEAASALGPKVTRLAIYEAPYDEAAAAAGKWRAYRTEQARLLADGKRSEAVLHHLQFAGVPKEAIEGMRTSPAWAEMERLAPTLPHDVAVIGDDRTVPVERAAKVQAPTLVVDGGASRQMMPFMRVSADRIAAAIPGAQRRTIDGQGHNVAADAIAPVLVEFFSAR